MRTWENITTICGYQYVVILQYVDGKTTKARKSSKQNCWCGACRIIANCIINIVQIQTNYWSFHHNIATNCHECVTVFFRPCTFNELPLMPHLLLPHWWWTFMLTLYCPQVFFFYIYAWNSVNVIFICLKCTSSTTLLLGALNVIKLNW